MENDKLKKYIQDHIEEFDVFDPPAHVWDNVSKSIQGDKRKSRAKVISIRHWMWAASAAVVIFFVGIRLGQMSSVTSDPTLLEWQEAEQYYQHQVAYKMGEIKGTTQEIEALPSLEELDKYEAELKKELLNNKILNKSEVIRLLIENYNYKIQLLETLEEKSKNKQINTNSNEEYISI